MSTFSSSTFFNFNPFSPWGNKIFYPMVQTTRGELIVQKLNPVGLGDGVTYRSLPHWGVTPWVLHGPHLNGYPDWHLCASPRFCVPLYCFTPLRTYRYPLG